MRYPLSSFFLRVHVARRSKAAHISRASPHQVVGYTPRPDEVMLVRYVQPLSDEQRELLEKTMKEDTACRTRNRAHSLLLSTGGTPIQTIIRAYKVYRITVSAWIKKWEQHDA